MKSANKTCQICGVPHTKKQWNAQRFIRLAGKVQKILKEEGRR